MCKLLVGRTFWWGQSLGRVLTILCCGEVWGEGQVQIEPVLRGRGAKPWRCGGWQW